MTDLPQNWKKSEKSLRAIQLAFEFTHAVVDTIRLCAAEQGLSASDQIRAIIGLPIKKPQRPRLTISLSEEDYQLLAQRYHLNSDDKNSIRQLIVKEILVFAEQQDKENRSAR